MTLNAETTQQSYELPNGSMLLQGQYEIQRHLAIGGFGMTYLARDSLSRQVVVKECFPEGLCIRHGRLVLPDSDAKQVAYQKIVWNFVAEARRLARLKHPNIVGVHQVFEENHTAYMAMDHVEGVELLDILEDTPERLTPALIAKMLHDALAALRHLHGEGFLHRDISPDNLLLDSRNHLTLIDFGAARETTHLAPGAATFLLAVKDGYSPHEFYVEDAEQDASSDLYSLAATFYHLIAGESPPDCWTRLQALKDGEPDPCIPLVAGDWPFSPAFLELIDQALSVAKKDRIQSAAEWLQELSEITAELESDGTRPITETLPELELNPVPPPAEIDMQAITKLVQDTNTGLTVCAMPQQSNPAKALAPAPEFKAPKQLVDIFGNPIEDVDAWLREQDGATAEETAALAKAAKDDGEQSETAETRPRSLISRLILGSLGLTRNTESVV